MKFNELPQNMQKSLLKGRRKAVVIAGIVFTVFFLALTALCFFIGHGFEKLWFIPAICVFIGFVGILLELKELDISNLTPLDALNTLNRLQNKIRNRW